MTHNNLSYAITGTGIAIGLIGILWGIFGRKSLDVSFVFTSRTVYFSDMAAYADSGNQLNFYFEIMEYDNATVNINFVPCITTPKENKPIGTSSTFGTIIDLPGILNGG